MTERETETDRIFTQPMQGKDVRIRRDANIKQYTTETRNLYNELSKSQEN